MHRTLLAATLAAALFSTTPVLEPLWRLLTRVWNETGCQIDPDGQCLADSAAGSADEGCMIDPDGRCLPGTAGAPAATNQGDEGCHIDPSGRCGA